VVALDMRHHGQTVCDDSEDAELDFMRDTLKEDVLGVWSAMFADEAPPTVLVGHSVGGAIAVWAALTEGIPTLEGLIVIDVVEGTALGAHLTLSLCLCCLSCSNACTTIWYA
jgi:protein phosphatase methylesterase 1